MGQTHFQDLNEQFQAALLERRKHLNTIRSYANDLKQFGAWCRSTFGEGMLPRDLTRSDVQDFRTFLLTRNSSPASVNRKITALRQFFEFCIERGEASANPAAEIAGVAAEPRAPEYLPRKDALLLARTAERESLPLDAAIVLLLLHGGLRSSEICGLTIGDLHITPREGRVFIKGQRGKTTRFVYLSSRAQAALRRYCHVHGINMLARRQRRDPLFASMDGTPISQQAVDQVVKRIGRIAGLPDVTPSMLRNTFIAQALMGGTATETVARTMGVTSLKSITRLRDVLLAGIDSSNVDGDRFSGRGVFEGLDSGEEADEGDREVDPTGDAEDRER
jgi:site-specific recombinase XerD